MTLAEKLMAHSIPEPNSGCWLWLLGGSNGYGQLLHDGIVQYAHRLSYLAYRGPISPGMFVCHKCDVPACVNPDHLFLGTPKDNSADMARKGRTIIRPSFVKGEHHGMAQLSAEDVIAIRVSTSPYADIASRYGISTAYVSNIRCGKTWKHLPLGRLRKRGER